MIFSADGINGCDTPQPSTESRFETGTSRLVGRYRNIDTAASSSCHQMTGSIFSRKPAGLCYSRKCFQIFINADMNLTRTTEEQSSFCVVVNAEGQYSLWNSDLPIPSGWRETGMTGNKRACIDYVDQVWTDMRPASLRQRQ
ncbi:MbtH family protein [Ralstonia solanacearum]|uniref:MbtH family protein n=1 Tax=Ralstonia solanacearum TaxID=305 RepID=UPI00399D71F2